MDPRVKTALKKAESLFDEGEHRMALLEVIGAVRIVAETVGAPALGSDGEGNDSGGADPSAPQEPPYLCIGCDPDRQEHGCLRRGCKCAECNCPTCGRDMPCASCVEVYDETPREYAARVYGLHSRRLPPKCGVCRGQRWVRATDDGWTAKCAACGTTMELPRPSADEPMDTLTETLTALATQRGSDDVIHALWSGSIGNSGVVVVQRGDKVVISCDLPAREMVIGPFQLQPFEKATAARLATLQQEKDQGLVQVGDIASVLQKVRDGLLRLAHGGSGKFSDAMEYAQEYADALTVIIGDGE